VMLIFLSVTVIGFFSYFFKKIKGPCHNSLKEGHHPSVQRHLIDPTPDFRPAFTHSR